MTIDSDGNQPESLPGQFCDFTFEHFVSSPGNQDALKVVRALADQQAMAEYRSQASLLFLHGGSGLGKTHLLVAMAHDILQRQPGRRVRYLTAEEFLGEVLPAFRNGDPRSLIQSYSALDMLIIDNVDNLIPMEQTQNKVWKIFELVVQQGTTVALASGLPIQEMHGFQFETSSQPFSVLELKILPLDRDGRAKLIRKRLAMLKGSSHPIVHEDAVAYLASLEVVDARSLIGKLTCLLFMSEVAQTPLTLELMTQTLLQLE